MKKNFNRVTSIAILLLAPVWLPVAAFVAAPFFIAYVWDENKDRFLNGEVGFLK